MWITDAFGRDDRAPPFAVTGPSMSRQLLLDDSGRGPEAAVANGGWRPKQERGKGIIAVLASAHLRSPCASRGLAHPIPSVGIAESA